MPFHVSVRLGVIALLVGSLAGCYRPPDRPAEAPTDSASADLEVDFRGCDVVEGVCTLEPGTGLRLWASAAPGWRLEIATPRGWSVDAAITRHGGLHYEVGVSGRGRLVVTAVRDGARATWQIPVIVAPASNSILAFEKRIQAGASTADLERLLERLVASEPTSEGPLCSTMAQHLYRRGEDRLPLLDRAQIAHGRDRRTGAHVFAIGRAVRLLLDRGHIQEASKRLALLPDEDASWPAAAKREARMIRALFAELVGNLSLAAEKAQAALRIAERLGWDQTALVATDLLARQLRRLGEHTSAGALFADVAQRLEQGSAVDCSDHGKLLNNLAWDRMTVFDLGGVSGHPQPLLARSYAALQRCDQDNLARAELAFGRIVDMALANVQRGDFFLTKALIDQAGRMTIEPRRIDALWLAVVQARWAVGVGELKRALERSDEVERLAGGAFSSEARLAVAPVRAQAYEQMGHIGRAIVSLEQAQGWLGAQSGRLLPRPRAALLLAQGEQATRQLIDLQLRTGQTEAALLTVVGSRARLFRALDFRGCVLGLDPQDRQEWQDMTLAFAQAYESLAEDEAAMLMRPLNEQVRHRDRLAKEFADIQASFETARRRLLGPCDEAARPTAADLTAGGQLVLAYHALPQGWVAIAADDQGIESVRIDEVGEAASDLERADRLLMPFYDKLVEAARIHVLPSGILEGVDFHALPFAQGSLLDLAPVVYGFGLPARAAREPPTPTAIVVGDPRRDLPHAYEASQGVAESFRDTPYHVTLLRHDEATRAAVLDALETADRLHFAGHGEIDETTGESTLLLAGRETLGISDLLATERMPRHAVLLSCSAANALGPTPIARVILARGAHTVVASTRQLRDQVAATFAANFYRALAARGDEASAVQGALLAVRDKHPDADWASIRLLARQR